MSAAKARKPGRKENVEDAARRVALYDHPGYLDVTRAQAALWLLEQIDGGHLSFARHEGMTAEELEDWVRGIAKDAVAASLNTAGNKLARASLEQIDTGKAEA